MIPIHITTNTIPNPNIIQYAECGSSSSMLWTLLGTPGFVGKYVLFADIDVLILSV